MVRFSYRGFSLAEVLVAVLVMSIALVGASTVLLSSMRMEKKVSSGAVARALADELLERGVRRLPGSVNESGFWDGTHATLDNPWSEGTETVGRATFQYWITGEPVMNRRTGKVFGTDGAATGNGLARIRVTVRWTGTEEEFRQGHGNLELVASRLVNRAP